MLPAICHWLDARDEPFRSGLSTCFIWVCGGDLSHLSPASPVAFSVRDAWTLLIWVENGWTG